MEIVKAISEDLPQILELQKMAYLSEAELLNNFSIQPLTQTLDELKTEFEKEIILKLINEDKKIIGSVRAYERDECVYIGKLIVHPEYQNNGFGTKLLQTIETFYKNKTFELFTSYKSDKNIRLYEKNGYKKLKQERISENMEFVYLNKKK